MEVKAMTQRSTVIGDVLYFLKDLISSNVTDPLTTTSTQSQTGYIDPNGDISTEWDVTGESTNYEAIDDAVRQPTTPNVNNCISSYTSNLETKTDIYDMGTLTDVSSVDQIKIWVYGILQLGATVKADISVDGTNWEGEQNVITEDTGSDSWYSVTFSGLNYTQAQLDSLQVKIINKDVSGIVTPHSASVRAMYAEVTYEETTTVSTRGSSSNFVMTSFPEREVKYPLITLEVTDINEARAGMQVTNMDVTLTCSIRIWSKSVTQSDKLAQEILDLLADEQYTANGSVDSEFHDFNITSVNRVDEPGKEGTKSRIIQLTYRFFNI